MPADPPSVSQVSSNQLKPTQGNSSQASSSQALDPPLMRQCSSAPAPSHHATTPSRAALPVQSTLPVQPTLPVRPTLPVQHVLRVGWSAQSGHGLYTTRSVPSGTLHSRDLTLHPSPFTLHPSPLTPHPSPLTLHPSPFTLHPSPSPSPWRVCREPQPQAAMALSQARETLWRRVRQRRRR